MLNILLISISVILMIALLIVVFMLFKIKYYMTGVSFVTFHLGVSNLLIIKYTEFIDGRYSLFLFCLIILSMYSVYFSLLADSRRIKKNNAK